MRTTFRLALGAALFGAAATCCASARADEPLAGGELFAVSHGQPFCTTREALAALLRAQVARGPLGPILSGACRYVDDNSIVAVSEDLSPGGRYMHVVRARARVLLGTVDGYTYSVGLYPYPVRQPPFRLFAPLSDY